MASIAKQSYVNSKGQEVFINKALAETVLCYIDYGLEKGLGVPKKGQMCIEACVNFAMGMEHGDRPPCVHENLRALKIELNDRGICGILRITMRAVRPTVLLAGPVWMAGLLKIGQRAWKYMSGLIVTTSHIKLSFPMKCGIVLNGEALMSKILKFFLLGIVVLVPHQFPSKPFSITLTGS